MKRQDSKDRSARFIIKSLILVLFALPLAGAAFAEDFPTKEIEVVINFAPGGSTDLMARIVGDKASKILKVPFVYNNKTGGGGAIAANAIASAKPDGYTIGTGNASNMGVIVATSSSIPYTLKDFSAIARGVIVPFVVFTKKGRFESFADLVKEAKQKPGEIMFGSFGAKSTTHLLGELINQVVGIKLKHVPFEGDSKAFVAVLGGHVDIGVTTPTTLLANIKSGGVTPLAVATPDRLEMLPDVPTLSELGYPGATFSGYDGFITSSKVPPDRLSILRTAFEKSMKDPEVQEALKKTGTFPAYLSGQDYDAFMASSLDKLKEAAAKAGIKD
jgi:tripartite-type tricarboxylate transporter receptor subunit TctC